MPRWQLRILLISILAASVLPLILCASLWRSAYQQQIVRWRRVASMIGLGLATAASFTPPIWFFTMMLHSQNTQELSSKSLDRLLFAVFFGLASLAPGIVGLCFGCGRVRLLGTAACVLDIALLAFSLIAAGSGAAGL